MEVTVEHLGAMQFNIKARQHTIVSDQPESSGGFDEGMTPPEFLLASLGSCAAYYAAAYLRQERLTKQGTWVRVTADKVKDPPRMDNFRIEVGPPVALSAEQRKGLEESVRHCLIHNTLLFPPRIELSITSANIIGDENPIAA
jgi:putative redox protein